MTQNEDNSENDDNDNQRERTPPMNKKKIENRETDNRAGVDLRAEPAL